MRTANAGERRARPQDEEPSAIRGTSRRGAAAQGGEALRPGDAARRPHALPAASGRSKPGPMKALSVRAQNVLKELAPDLTGEQPPKGSWVPSRELLLALTAERLATARNCGPHTTREIIEWAQGCGITIGPTLQRSRSLSQMWASLIANASTGALTSAEAIAALERSIRRKSVRIPIAFQIILVKILLSSFE